MNYIVDILVVILLLFMVLYALKQRTSKYLVVFITYFVPMVVVFLLGSPIYLNLLKSEAAAEKFKDLFASSYYLSGYLTTEILLYIILVIVLKFIFYLFKNTSLIADVNKEKKKKTYINLILALILGYFYANLLVGALYPLGLTNENGLLKDINQNSLLIDLNDINQLNQNLQVYESIVELIDILALDDHDPDFLQKIKAYAESAGPRMKRRVRVFVDTCDNTIEPPLNYFTDEKIIKPYLNLIVKKKVVKNVISNKVFEDDLFTEIIIENWAHQYSIDLANISESDILKLENNLQKLELSNNANSKLKDYWK